MKTTRLIQLLIVAVLGLSMFTSCESCIEGNGIIASETRIVSGDFDAIELDGSFEVYYTQDSVVSIEVEGDDNLLSYVTTVVRNHELIIDQTNRCFRIDDPIRVYVSSPHMTSFQLDGSGLIQCEDLYEPGERVKVELDGSGDIDIFGIYAEMIDVNLDGSGDIYLRNISTEFTDAHVGGSGEINLRGESVETELSISGSGDIEAFDLDQEDCDANISGSGNIKIYVYDNLWVNISGSGYVYYRGYPNIRAYDNSGSGKLVNRN